MTFLGEAAKLLAKYNINYQTVGVALALAIIGWTANKISNIIISRMVRRRGGDKHAAKSAKKVSAYVIFPLTLVAVLGVFGAPLSGLAAALGLIGLGLSFALKDIIANFISGIMILVNRPFKIGDQINIEGHEGEVEDIRVRASEIRAFDGKKIIVPNSVLYSEIVINNTAYDSRRFEVVVGVGYDDDVGEAVELAMEALEEAEGVEENPEPQVLVDELGGSSVNLKLRGWTAPSRSSLVKASSEVTRLVKEKLEEEGIDIPYPIRTVQMDE